MTSGKGCRIYGVFKTFNFCRLEDAKFTMPWRDLIYEVLRTSDLWQMNIVEINFLENIQITMCWRRPKSVEQRRSYVYIISKEIIFFILYRMKYSENFKCSCLG